MFIEYFSIVTLSYRYPTFISNMTYFIYKYSTKGEQIRSRFKLQSIGLDNSISSGLNNKSKLNQINLNSNQIGLSFLFSSIRIENSN